MPLTRLYLSITSSHIYFLAKAIGLWPMASESLGNLLEIQMISLASTLSNLKFCVWTNSPNDSDVFKFESPWHRDMSVPTSHLLLWHSLHSGFFCLSLVTCTLMSSPFGQMPSIKGQPAFLFGLPHRTLRLMVSDPYVKTHRDISCWCPAQVPARPLKPWPSPILARSPNHNSRAARVSVSS